MTAVLDVIWHGVRDALLMAWEVWWALVLGFAISAIVQAWVPRQRIERALGGRGARPVALGDRRSARRPRRAPTRRSRSPGRCSQKGASAASALAFQFASTNLVWELGLVLWVLIGWQFTVAEYLGGIVMIVLMALLLRRSSAARWRSRRACTPRPRRHRPSAPLGRRASRAGASG